MGYGVTGFKEECILVIFELLTLIDFDQIIRH